MVWKGWVFRVSVSTLIVVMVVFPFEGSNSVSHQMCDDFEGSDLIPPRLIAAGVIPENYCLQTNVHGILLYRAEDEPMLVVQRPSKNTLYGRQGRL